MLAILITLAIQAVLGQKPSPCPSLFAYEFHGYKSDRWYGRIDVAITEELDEIQLRIELDKPALFLRSTFGGTTTENDRDFVIRNVEPIHDSFSVRFFVMYDEYLAVIPSVVRIRLNGEIICDSLIQPSSVTEEKKCGSVKIRDRPLITNGQSTFKGEWPWHAAIYLYEGINMKYVCSGSLITRKHVLTAAHCVTQPSTNILLKQELLIIHLGKHNRYTLDSNVQIRGVSQITTHPAYDISSLINDLAVLQLDRDVEYTDFVRYVCLCDEDTGLNGILDRIGTVVSWAGNETSAPSEYLMQAKMPVLSTESCILSELEYFHTFISDKTFCAGFTNDTSTCSGDSGGGIFFPKQARDHTTIWRLRGVISVSVRLSNKKLPCHTTHYIVFADVAKHLDWIKSITKYNFILDMNL